VEAVCGGRLLGPEHTDEFWVCSRRLVLLCPFYCP
jgi:hypothetical protein